MFSLFLNSRYEDTLYKFFSILKTSKSLSKEEQHELDEQQQQQHSLPVDSFRHILKEVLSSEKGTKFYVCMRSVSLQTPQPSSDSSEHHQPP